MTSVISDWKDLIRNLGESFAPGAAEHDEHDSFVSANWAELKKARLFSAMVPPELGGSGLPHSQMCSLILELAQYCSSTALAFSMHQHLVAAAIWNYRHGNPGEKLLRRVADGETVLVSTGANDWLGSSGALEPCDGGFRFSGSKAFASGCPGGDLLITSGRYNDPVQGWQVLHFPVSLRAEGVRIEDNWKAMGMRGTGSHTVVLQNVFVPAEAIGLRRPAGKYHPVWNIVLTVAMPLVVAAYVGTATAAARIARQGAAERAAKSADDMTAILVGEMENELVTARLAFESMVAIANDLDFEPSLQKTSDMLIRKTIATQAAIRTASKALEVTGGTGYFRSAGLERLLRDVYAGQFHPLPPQKQHRFTGRLSLGLDVDNGEAIPARA
jgi:alkylation response protein AidB-like acyl-CoA dehydrogenase